MRSGIADHVWREKWEGMINSAKWSQNNWEQHKTEKKKKSALVGV